jgi:hypothetical protein
MVEVKLCVIKLDGTSEYRRIAIPVLTPHTDVLSILREKMSQLFPEVNSPTNGIHLEFQYEGKKKRNSKLKQNSNPMISR